MKKVSNSTMTQNTKTSKQQTLNHKYAKTGNDAKKEIPQKNENK
jgi:hypothetical protein